MAACLDLSELDQGKKIYQAYRVIAWFEPEGTDDYLAPCRSIVYREIYTQTMSESDLSRA